MGGNRARCAQVIPGRWIATAVGLPDGRSLPMLEMRKGCPDRGDGHALRGGTPDAVCFVLAAGFGACRSGSFPLVSAVVDGLP
jgi:hypothetical protein